MSPADSPFASLPAAGPHPAPAELRAYAAGTLSPADEHRLEAHTLDCERCADLVAGFSMSDAATTDQALATLRTRLQARLATEEPAPVAGSWAWPRLAAAAALVAAVGGGIWTLEQHQATPTITPPTTVAVAPPAARPAPDVALAPPPPPPITAAPQAPPATAPTADYAAVVPSQSARHGLLGNADQASRPEAEAADYAVLSDKKVESTSVSAEVSAPVASAPAAVSATGSGTVNAAPAGSGEVSVSGWVSADSTLPSTAMALLARKSVQSKAKAAVADAPASVPNTAMPTVPTLSPAPVGGTLALRDYLRREASQFVPEINNLRISGTVHIRFVVGADGKLSNLKVTHGMRPDYDEEALRLLCEGPAWQPGVAGGKRAPLPMEVTVPF